MSKRLKRPKPCTSCERPIARIEDRHYRNGHLVCRECIYGDGPQAAQVLPAETLPKIKPERRASVLGDETPTILDFTRPKE